MYIAIDTTKSMDKCTTVLGENVEKLLEVVAVKKFQVKLLFYSDYAMTDGNDTADSTITTTDKKILKAELSSRV